MSYNVIIPCFVAVHDRDILLQLYFIDRLKNKWKRTGWLKAEGLLKVKEIKFK